MAANKLETFGPVALTNTLTTDIIHPAAAGAGGIGYTPTATYIIIRHIHIANKTGGAVTFSLWLGASGGNVAGTEVFNAKSVAANDAYDWYGQLRIKSSQTLVGGASANTSLTLLAEGEVGLE